RPGRALRPQPGAGAGVLGLPALAGRRAAPGRLLRGLHGLRAAGPGRPLLAGRGRLLRLGGGVLRGAPRPPPGVPGLARGAGTAGTVAVVGYYSQGLPSLDQLREGSLDQTTRIYDRNGVQISSLYQENRTIVALAKIAPALQDATISVEDRTFYSHQGVDYRR